MKRPLAVVIAAIAVAAVTGRSVVRGQNTPAPQTPATTPRPGATPAPQGRGTAPAPAGRGAAQAPGTAIIRGRVMAADTGAALRRAEVTFRAQNASPTAAPVVATDDQGRYEMTGLRAGRYTISVVSPGYVSLSYGQRRPLEAARPVEVADGQAVERIDFALPRGAVVVVHVTDDFGEPVAGVFMNMERYQFANGQRRLSSISVNSVQTDDRGDARFSSVPPGDYYISANPAFGRTASVLDVSDSRRFFAEPTYYPGTAALKEAQQVTVGLGQELNLSFPLVAVRTARITGMLRSTDGSVPRVSLSVTQQFASGSSGNDTTVRPDGSFELLNVMPGEYVLNARPPFDARNVSSAPPAEYARMPLTVTGEDISGLVMTTRRGVSTSGRILFDGGALPPNLRPGDLDLFLTVDIAPGVTTSSSDDWSFEIRDAAGKGTVRLRTASNGWFLKRVLSEDKDITDVATDVADMKDLQVIVSQKRSEVSGGVVDSRNAPATDYVAVFFSEDRAQWTAQSRFIAVARPDQQGQYKVLGLPAGRYFAAAVDFLETGQERDVESLTRLQAGAQRVTIAEDETKTVTLKLTVF